MPAAPAAPPPAPTTTAPKAAPAPSPNAKPAAPTPPEPQDAFADAFAEIDTMETGKPAPKKEAKKDEQNPTAAKPAEKEDASSTNLEDDSIVPPAPKDDGKKPDEKPPVKAAELRTAYDSLKKKVKEEYEPKLQKLTTLEKKVQELEATTPQLDKANQERVAAIEKRNQEREAAIKFKDYELDADYQEKYWKPYEQAWSNAIRELKGLSMTVEDPKTGESVTREVTQADLQYFASLEPAARRTEINRLFPEDKEEVKRHINQISHLFEQTQAAKAKAKQDAETFAKTREEQQQQFQQNRAKLWRQTNEALATKYPNWFNKVEGDNEGNTLFDRGSALADLAMFPQDISPEKIAMLPKAFQEAINSKKPFTQEQIVKLHSIVRNKAANHDRLAHQNKGLLARVAELEKSLKDYEASGPDGARAADGGSAVKGELTADQELDALERQFKG